jgi:drug/metabolite transporter (DMT)-like permease
VLLATLIWGTLHPVGKVALQSVTPAQLVLARALLTGVALLLLLTARGRLSVLVETARARPLPIVGLGLLSFFASSGLSMTGLSYLPASVNSLLANTSPLMLAMGLALARRRAPRPRVLLGLALGFAGVTLLSLRGAADLGAVGLLGVLLSLGGSLTWAIYTGWSRRELQGGDPIAITTGAALVGSAPLLAIVALAGDLGTLAAAPPGALWLLLYMGVVGTALTYGLWMSGLRRLSAMNVSAFQYVIPLNAVALSVVALGEPLTPALVLGGAAILAGVGLAQERG